VRMAGAEARAVLLQMASERLQVPAERLRVKGGVVADSADAKKTVTYAQLTEGQRDALQAVAMDMWEPYIRATREGLPEGVEKIVFDRYHATRSVKKDAAGSLNLDLVRDNRMPGRGRSA
jgi:hypothetical protein